MKRKNNNNKQSEGIFEDRMVVALVGTGHWLSWQWEGRF